MSWFKFLKKSPCEISEPHEVTVTRRLDDQEFGVCSECELIVYRWKNYDDDRLPNWVPWRVIRSSEVWREWGEAESVTA